MNSTIRIVFLDTTKGSVLGTSGPTQGVTSITHGHCFRDLAISVGSRPSPNKRQDEELPMEERFWHYDGIPSRIWEVDFKRLSSLHPVNTPSSMIILHMGCFSMRVPISL
jgi:hypothetical protein